MNELQPTFTARYVCGECDYDRVLPWPAHQAHYVQHQIRDAGKEGTATAAELLAERRAKGLTAADLPWSPGIYVDGPDESRRLCALQASNDCLGYVTAETAWHDEDGQAWDVCPPCREHEAERAASRGV